MKPAQEHHWSVAVEIDGERILAIGENSLFGIENVGEHADTIEACALHLLSFIGRMPSALDYERENEVTVRLLASLAAAISILERTPKSKKVVASDRMFDLMLDDYRSALDAGRSVLCRTPALRSNQQNTTEFSPHSGGTP